MDELKIIELYNEGYTLRHISDIFRTDHHRIKRVLVKNNIEITKRQTKKEYTEEHKRKIGVANKGNKCWSTGLKMSRDHVLKNMKGHLKYDVSLEWLNTFSDIEKLKFLNKSITRERDKTGFTTEIYTQFIEKFYNDKKFNELYFKWIETNDKWIKPSLDHIQAKCNGGSLLIDNLQFISWLENRAKADIKQEIWNIMKQNINYYL
jgi:hypothetical protein